MRSLTLLGPQNVAFKFHAGEATLWSLSRTLCVLECEPGTTPETGWLDRLPPLARADGYLVKGLPPEAAGLPPREGFMHRIMKTYPRHTVDLTTTYDEYLGKFSSKTRSTLKRKQRKFAELAGGAIDWREYKTRDEIASFLPRARELSAKTYQERLLDAGLPTTEAFTNEALARADRGAVRAYLMFLSDKPVSYLYLPVDDGRVVYAYLGYDPAVADHSPGTVLQLLAMERLFAEKRFQLFDFTEGAGQHKEMFATHVQNCIDLLILKRSLATQLVVRSHAAFEWAGAQASNALDTLGVKKQLKRLMRSLASRAK